MRLILVGHGEFPEGLLEAAEMIAGPRAGTAALPLRPGASLDDFRAALDALVARGPADQGVLILADLQGGTPFNAAAALALKDPRVRVVAGANLAMVLECAMALADEQDPGALARLAESAGQEGIRRFEGSGA